MAGSEAGKWAPHVVPEAKGLPWLLLLDMHGGPALLVSPWKKGRRLEPWQAEAAASMRERAAKLAGGVSTTAAWISPDGGQVTPFKPESAAWIARKLADFAAIGVQLGPDQPTTP